MDEGGEEKGLRMVEVWKKLWVLNKQIAQISQGKTVIGCILYPYSRSGSAETEHKHKHHLRMHIERAYTRIVSGCIMLNFFQCWDL